MGKLPDIVLRLGWDRSLHRGGVKGAPIVQFVSGLHLGCVFPGRYGSVRWVLRMASSGLPVLQDLAH